MKIQTDTPDLPHKYTELYYPDISTCNKQKNKFKELVNEISHSLENSFRFVSFRFVSWPFFSFRLVSFRFVSFRFVSWPFFSFRLVSFMNLFFFSVSFLNLLLFTFSFLNLFRFFRFVSFHFSNPALF
jgi:hypothetical protein